MTVLSCYIQNSNRKLKALFRIRREKFFDFQQYFDELNDNLALFSQLIDEAHRTLKRKNKKKSHPKEELDILFTNRKWTKHSNPEIINNLSDYTLSMVSHLLWIILIHGSIFKNNFKSWNNKNTNSEINTSKFFWHGN